MKSLIIWGCGGHGRVVFDIVVAMQTFRAVLFFEDGNRPTRDIFGSKVMSGGFSDVPGVADMSFVIAIGSNRVRAARFAEAELAGCAPATCIHPSAVISPFAHIGPGTVVMPHAVVQSGARVGRNCIINTAALVEHDCVIGDHTHLSPASALGGGVTVGQYVHLGIGTIAIPGSSIGEGAVLGAGAVVLGHIAANVTAVGIPAKPLTGPDRK